MPFHQSPQLRQILFRSNPLNHLGREYLPAHRTEPLGRVLLEPFENAMEVEVVSTSVTQDQRTPVAGKLAVGARAIKRNSANATELIAGARSGPMPRGHTMPLFDLDLHGGMYGSEAGLW